MIDLTIHMLGKFKYEKQKMQFWIDLAECCLAELFQAFNKILYDTLKL